MGTTAARSGSSSAVDAGAARETIAIRIIDLARAGESPTKLRDRVLAETNGGTGL